MSNNDGKSGLKIVFEALWPKKKPEIEAVFNRIGRHTTMLRNEVRLEHIQAEYDARAREIENFETLQESTRRLEYRGLETAMAAMFYDAKLNSLRGRLCEGTGNWLLRHHDMSRWLTPAEQDSPKVIWLRGIPGAGKFKAITPSSFATNPLEHLSSLPLSHTPIFH